jgi:hypothetical protein
VGRRFTINSVAPGRYILRARGDDSETPQFAAQPISVNGADSVGRHRRPLPVRRSAARCRFCRRLAGARLHAVPDHGALDRPVGLRPAIERASTRTDITISGISAGAHLIRPSNGSRTWFLQSVTIGGRDVTDTPFQVRSGENLSQRPGLHRQAKARSTAN